MLKLNHITLATLLLCFTQLMAADFTGPNRDAEGNIVPTPKGESCIAPIDEMRRNHMDMLLHKRDQTVHDGIRSKKASLVECINCHVTPNADGQVARIDSNQHFCSSCHVAASVSIDCFECHADRPAEMIGAVTDKTTRLNTDFRSAKPQTLSIYADGNYAEGLLQ